MLETLSQDIQARAEEVMRRAIRRLPDGTYSHSVSLDGFDRPHRDRLRDHHRERRARGRLHRHFRSGRPRRSERRRRLHLGLSPRTRSSASLDPLTYRNEGSYRPFTIKAPEGSILNATYPSAVSSRHLTGHCITSAVFGALAQVLPDTVIADSGSTPQYISFFSGMDEAMRPFSLMLFLSGGMGASSAEDGIHCSPIPKQPRPRID